jgi:hypothetical protein
MVKIICEGPTDKNKISELLTFLNISYNDDNFIVMGNKSNIFKEEDTRYKVLLGLIKSDKIEQVLFIVDADYQKDNHIYGGYDKTKNEIEKLFINLKVKNISDYYITCNPISKDGYLESLLLSTVDDNLKICYDEFLDCIDFKEKNQHKYIMEQLHKITQPNKPYNFNNQNFNELKKN